MRKIAETRHEFSNIIQSNNELLQRLIGDVLDLSKIESNTMTLIWNNEMNIGSLMKEIYSMILLRMPAGVELRLDDCEALTMETDRNSLTQILTNLLTNAIKHTEKGFIRFGYTRTAASVEFFVKDSGEGIPRRTVGTGFQPFCQIEIVGAMALAWDWLSVGKALVTKLGGRIDLVEQMGGTIWVTSELGKGSIFYVTLPLTSSRMLARKDLFISVIFPR
ncbi:MAG: HAMP domain-containing sensor histidine kinase [Parabacteroides distasonis]